MRKEQYNLIKLDLDVSYNIIFCYLILTWLIERIKLSLLLFFSAC